jgi:hypothetical protein
MKKIYIAPAVILILAAIITGGCGKAPGYFTSLSALNEWLLGNDVSGKPATAYAEDWYGRGLEVQEDAFKDGYIISVDYDYNEEDDSYVVWCTTVINGRVFFWDPEDDQVYEDEYLGTVK